MNTPLAVCEAELTRLRTPASPLREMEEGESYEDFIDYLIGKWARDARRP